MGQAESGARRVNSNAEFAESLEYLAKADIRGELRTTKNRHSSVRRQPMYESRRPHQVQDEDQQYSRCREFSQITRSVRQAQPSLPRPLPELQRHSKVDNPRPEQRQQISRVNAVFVRHPPDVRR